MGWGAGVYLCCECGVDEVLEGSTRLLQARPTHTDTESGREVGKPEPRDRRWGGVMGYLRAVLVGQVS